MDRDGNERGVRLEEVIARAVEAFGKRTPKSLPAKVVRVDAAKRAVDCKVLVMRSFIDEEDARQIESIPVIPSVPLSLPPFYAPPISDGTLVFAGSTLPATTGALVWCDRSLDRWLSGSGQEVDPELDHDHALVDAWFVPGLYPYGAVPFALPQDSILIGDDTGAPFAARKGDGVGSGTIQFSFTAGSGAAALSITYTPGDGSAPQSLAAGTGTITIKELIKSGSTKVKIG
jgi:hypothetical protein